MARKKSGIFPSGCLANLAFDNREFIRENVASAARSVAEAAVYGLFLRLQPELGER
jgi:hypothetical protein